MHPITQLELVKLHQQELIAEAERDRLVGARQRNDLHLAALVLVGIFIALVAMLA